jgi:thiamine-monophosphate kinase
LSGIATAALDVSDGLVADLRHICEVSRIDAIIEAPLVPLSTVAREAIAGRRERLATALTGGDDYEILFTAPPTAAGRIDDLAQELAISITAIGQMVAPSGAAASARRPQAAANNARARRRDYC